MAGSWPNRSTAATAWTSDSKGRARLSSSTSELFALAYGDPDVDAATGDAAWLRAMLDVEAGLARAAATLELIPVEHESAIEKACEPTNFNLQALAEGAGTAATPVISLVAQLRAQLPDDVGGSVHLGATSQDVLDTALVLLARRAVPIALASTGRVTGSLAALAREHRDTPQVGRTLLQHGAVTTFGLACAIRLGAVDDAAVALLATLESLPVQLGGAVGTLALPNPVRTPPMIMHAKTTGTSGAALMEAFAAELGLPAPDVPWHPTRGRVAQLAAAIGVLAGELGGVAQDLVTLASTEIGEVLPGAPGGSSAMPHKQNPSRAVLALACAHRIPGQVATILAGMPQQLQRDPGRWQAEWGTVVQLVRLLGGTARHAAAALDGAVVRTERMAAHVEALLELTGPRQAGNQQADTGAAGDLVDRVLARHEQLQPTDREER